MEEDGTYHRARGVIPQALASTTEGVGEEVVLRGCIAG